MTYAIAFDTETHLFGPGNMAPKVVCLSWSADNGEDGLIVDPAEIEATLHEMLDNAIKGDAVLVGQYAAYDMRSILRSFPSAWDKIWKAYQADGVVCTGVRERLLDISVGEFPYYFDRTGKKRKMEKYSLDEIAEKRLGIVIPKGPETWRLRYKELDGVPLKDWPKDAVSYALDDARIAHAIYVNQTARAIHSNYELPTQFEDTRADFSLALMSAWGIRTHADSVRSLWDETVEKMTKLAQEIDGTGLATWTKFNIPESESDRPKPVPAVKKSMSALREAIEKHYPEGKELPLTPGKKTKTSQDVIDECDYEPLKALAKFEGLRKVSNTYLSKMFAPTIHARFDAVGAASGRTSCSGPNLQNQPVLSGVRECFISRPGLVFLACDFDSQEMRTLAQICLKIVGRSKLAERYQADRHYDPHLEFGARLEGISVEEAARLLAEKNPHIKKLRQKAKICNFGFLGGMGAVTFSTYAKSWGVDIAVDEADKFRDGWFEQWPEMKTYFEHVRAVIGHGNNGTQINPLSGFRRGDCGYGDTANGYFQTLAAHASKAASFEVSRRCYNEPESALFGSRPVLFVHDEIISETPEAAAHEAAMETERILVESMEKWTPDIPAAASATLMYYWTKSAEPVFEDGRLVPWKEEEK